MCLPNAGEHPEPAGNARETGGKHRETPSDAVRSEGVPRGGPTPLGVDPPVTLDPASLTIEIILVNRDPLSGAELHRDRHVFDVAPMEPAAPASAHAAAAIDTRTPSRVILECENCAATRYDGDGVELGMVHHCSRGGLGAWRLLPLAPAPAVPSGGMQPNVWADTFPKPFGDIGYDPASVRCAHCGNAFDVSFLAPGETRPCPTCGKSAITRPAPSVPTAARDREIADRDSMWGAPSRVGVACSRCGVAIGEQDKARLVLTGSVIGRAWVHDVCPALAASARGAEPDVPTDLLHEADGLLSLVAYRYRIGPIPNDVRDDLIRVSLRCRKIAAARRLDREPAP